MLRLLDYFVPKCRITARCTRESCDFAAITTVNHVSCGCLKFTVFQVLQLVPSIDCRRHSSAPCYDRRKSSLHPDTVDRSPSTAAASCNNTLTPLAAGCSCCSTAAGWLPSCRCGMPPPATAVSPSEMGAVNAVASAATLLYGCANCGMFAGPVAVSAYRRRSFSVTPKGGLVNEGDMVLPLANTAAMDDLLQLSAVVAAGCGGADLSRRSSYNSTGSGGGGGSAADTPPVYRVLMLGGPGVGKTALTQQFLTSEFMAAQNTSFGKKIFLVLIE
jgi:hypothetical protein